MAGLAGSWRALRHLFRLLADGRAALAVAMVASMLSSNVTVAFILGALFCAVPIFLGASGLRGDWARRAFERWSIASQFQDFGPA